MDKFDLEIAFEKELEEFIDKSAIFSVLNNVIHKPPRNGQRNHYSVVLEWGFDYNDMFVLEFVKEVHSRRDSRSTERKYDLKDPKGWDKAIKDALSYLRLYKRFYCF
jgi:acyl carrier protein phosphodiesterase